MKRTGYGLRRITAALNSNLPDGHKAYTTTFVSRTYADTDVVKYGIVDDQTFQICQANKKKTQSGRPSDFQNLFRGLLICGRCGSPLAYRQPGKGRKDDYLLCSNKWLNKVAACNLPSLHYRRTEKALLEFLSLYSSYVFNTEKPDLGALSAKVMELEQHQDVLNTRLLTVTQNLQDLPELLSQSLAPIKAELFATKESLATATKVYQDAIAASSESFTIKAPETPDDRIAFNILLSRHLGKMVVHVADDGATYRIASISGKGVAIIGDRLGDRWELDDQPTSKADDTPEPALEFGAEFE